MTFPKISDYLMDTMVSAADMIRKQQYFEAFTRLKEATLFTKPGEGRDNYFDDELINSLIVDISTNRSGYSFNDDVARFVFLYYILVAYLYSVARKNRDVYLYHPDYFRRMTLDYFFSLTYVRKELFLTHYNSTTKEEEEGYRENFNQLLDYYMLSEIDWLFNTHAWVCKEEVEEKEEKQNMSLSKKLKVSLEKFKENQLR